MPSRIEQHAPPWIRLRIGELGTERDRPFRRPIHIVASRQVKVPINISVDRIDAFSSTHRAGCVDQLNPPIAVPNRMLYAANRQATDPCTDC